jgi:hypothetical protein
MSLLEDPHETSSAHTPAAQRQLKRTTQRQKLDTMRVASARSRMFYHTPSEIQIDQLAGSSDEIMVLGCSAVISGGTKR